MKRPIIRIRENPSYKFFGRREGNLKRSIFPALLAIIALNAAALNAQDKKGPVKQPAAPAAKTAPAVPAVDETSLVLKEAVGDAETGRPVAVFGLWDFIKMILVLAAVIGLIYAFFHFLKKMSAPKDEGLRLVQVLETRNLAGNRNLHLVEIGNQMLLVGSSENGVNLIAEITDKETRDAILLKSSEVKAQPSKKFSDMVKSLVAKRSEESLPAEGGQGSLEFMKKQKERLKKLL